jgi:hypothetical protein
MHLRTGTNLGQSVTLGASKLDDQKDIAYYGKLVTPKDADKVMM